MSKFPKVIQIEGKNGHVIRKTQFRDLNELKNAQCHKAFVNASQRSVIFEDYIEYMNKLEFIPDILNEKENLRRQMVIYSNLRTHLLLDEKDRGHMIQKYPSSKESDVYMEEQGKLFTDRKLEEANLTLAELTNKIEMIAFAYDKTFDKELKNKDNGIEK